MKKFLAFVMAASMALSLAACGGSSASTATSTTTEATSEAASAASTSGSKTDVAFVTDVGNIDDQSFNQYTWQGVQDFCSANNLSANYYRPTEDSDAARLEQMDNAVNDGAKSIVVAGYLFGSAIAEAQEKYPDVQFLALDVSTADLGDKTPTANTALITYKEEQAGYLAGYAAVYERVKLVSTFETKETPYGKIRIKKSSGYHVNHEKPEFEDLKAIAFKQGCSLKDVRNLLD